MQPLCRNLPNTYRMNHATKWLSAFAVGLAALVYASSFLWREYRWDLHVPSPDGRYDLVVLRGDAGAVDDFSYCIYVFPHASMPSVRVKDARVWLTPI